MRETGDEPQRCRGKGIEPRRREEREGKRRKKETLFPIFVSFRVPSGQYSWFNSLSVFLCVLCRVPSGQMRFIPGFSRFLSSHDLKFTPKITEALRAVRGDCDGVLDFDVANFRVVELGLD